MGYFGIPFRNGVPIGLGSIVGFGAPQEFSPSELFLGGTAGAWYDPSDLTTLFTTSAGTTPVAMPGQGSAVSVGLMLDKSQNGVGTNGAKRVNLLTFTEQFDNSAWAAFPTNSTITADAILAPNGTTTAELVVPNTSTDSHRVIQSLSTASALYTYSAYVKSAGYSRVVLFLNGPNQAATFNLTTETGVAFTKYGPAPSGIFITSVGNGWYRVGFTSTVVTSLSSAQIQVYNDSTTPDDPYAGNGTSGVYIWGAQIETGSTVTAYQNITSSWLATLPGNHAIAFNDTTARPELRARVNLLRWSEVFDATASGSAWVNTGVTVTDGVLAPNGTNTADTITGTTGTYPHVRQAITLPAAGTYKVSCYFQKTSGATRFPSIEINFSPGNAWVILNTDTGVATNAQGTPTNISVSDAGGYWLLSFEVAINITSATFYIYPASSSNGTTYAPNLTGSCVAWGADLRPANIGANVPAYQRIADANTYDTSGFPLYLRFDGIDDSMYTPANLNLSGTDKVSVFAGVRKLAQATNQRIVEFSDQSTINNGAFQILPGDWATGTGSSYSFSSRGTITAFAQSPANYAAPVSNVLTGFGDTAGDSVVLRINGTQVATSATDQGTGNFGTYPLFIGARNNSSLWFNGHLYSLVVAGSAVSAGNISATEQWVAGKVGLVLP